MKLLNIGAIVLKIFENVFKLCVDPFFEICLCFGIGRIWPPGFIGTV